VRLSTSFSTDKYLTCVRTSLAFLIYLLIVGLIELYSKLIAARDASLGLTADNFEMGPTSPPGTGSHGRRVSSKWYARVPASDPNTPMTQQSETQHIIRDDED
jgi:hypothetical protein